MSYLDHPRLQFAGLFKALPSTVNNVVQNYAGSYWSGDPDTPNQPTDLIDLVWAPNGTGIFDLVDCQVKGIAASPSIEDDPLVGAPVSAVYTKAPPKIVDLDPMQHAYSSPCRALIPVGSRPPIPEQAGHLFRREAGHFEGGHRNRWPASIGIEFETDSGWPPGANEAASQSVPSPSKGGGDASGAIADAQDSRSATTTVELWSWRTAGGQGLPNGPQHRG